MANHRIFQPRSYPRHALWLALVAVAEYCGCPTLAVASEPRQDDWIVSRHGPLVSCQSLRQQSDGSYRLERTLYPLLQKEVVKGESETDHRGLPLQLLVSAKRNPSQLPFFHESYRLNYQLHIVEGDISRGLVPAKLKVSVEDSPETFVPCQTLRKQVISAIKQSSDPLSGEQQSEDVWHLAVQGEGEKPVHDGTRLLNVAEASTPLMMVARGYAKDYQTVLEPLFRRTPVEFADADWSLYNRDHIPTALAISGLSASVATFSALAMLTNPMFIPGVGIGLGGMLVGLWQARDIMQTPEDRAEKKKGSLLTRYDLAREKLVLLQQQEQRYQADLEQDYGWSEQRYDLSIIRHGLEDQQRQYERDKTSDDETLRSLKQKLLAVQDEVDGRAKLDSELSELDQQLIRHRTLLSEQEDKLLSHRPGRGEAESNRKQELLAEWEHNKALLKDLLARHGQLQAKRDQHKPAAQLTMALKELQSQVSQHQSQLEQRAYHYERETLKPLTLLEQYQQNSEEIVTTREQVQDLKQELARSKVHAQLMMLVTAYQKHQRYARPRTSS